MVPLTPVASPSLPEPDDLRRILNRQLNDAIGVARAARGDVAKPSDVNALVRDLDAVRVRLAAYASAFTAVADNAKLAIGEEFVEAVGEQSGIPNAPSMTVPTAGGDIVIKRKTNNEYDIDMSQVLAAVATLEHEEWIARVIREPDVATAPEDNPVEFGIAVAQRVLDLFGAKAPGVTKVRAIADDLARQGLDSVASIVTDAIKKRVIYKGVDVSHKQPA